MTQWLIEEALLFASQKREADMVRAAVEGASDRERLREMATRAVKGF